MRTKTEHYEPGGREFDKRPEAAQNAGFAGGPEGARAQPE